MNMLDTIVPKSDQMNADDLIGTSRTITVSGVEIPGGEQPVVVHFEGDNGKPYKPGKSMRRVLVHVWGKDANAYVGRSMTLYRDEEVTFGGLKVGGIRISHMSHVEKTEVIALTQTRGNKKPHRVQPLKMNNPAPSADDKIAKARKAVDGYVASIAKADRAGLMAFTGKPEIVNYRERLATQAPVLAAELTKAVNDRLAELDEAESEDGGFSLTAPPDELPAPADQVPA